MFSVSYVLVKLLRLIAKIELVSTLLLHKIAKFVTVLYILYTDLILKIFETKDQTFEEKWYLNKNKEKKGKFFGEF